MSLEAILSRYENRKRDALIPLLWEVQTAFGFISAEAVHEISHTLHVPEADIYGVIGFYSLFHDHPTGEKIIRVCTDPSCGIAGADAVLHDLCHHLGIQHGETTSDGQYTVEHSTCLGMCEHAPAALISQRGMGEKSVGDIKNADELLKGQNATFYGAVLGGSARVLLDRMDSHIPMPLSSYARYNALRKALLFMQPEELIIELEQSGLIGRGGAAFPTGLKWKFTRQSQSEHYYLVCNADESEPGTFKDRVLMEGNPHLLLEGMALGAYAIGAEQGYLFIRGEYPEAARRMAEALAEAESANVLGSNIMGTDFSFHIEIRRGAGAYICGEETALFEAIEGKRGFPRVKPPYPTTYGLFGKPTVVNNVETLCTIPGIILHGAEWFRQHGTEKSTGTKLVSISGHIRRPGVYEILPGTSLSTFIDHH
ncbi:MAG: NAD(P)H-dependent oxidoreductase subunit E, partial [Anaerolineae bacterium]|nr:NAD(P)H-dependent oxidoreductase subunit E [Anaerolineae bacterium]